ncbi:MAG TPA: hypothetical protein VN696_14230 [Pyrinomonadaceae bacterium]|nr:hypothetical protein [Pyrinomonadaceae bacterium]
MNTRQALAFVLFVVAVIACKSTTSSNTSTKSSTSTNSGTTSSSANSSAPGTLSSLAPATHANIAGKYTITGTNPNGSSYRGGLEVIEHGDVYQFRWLAGNQSDGVGVVNGEVVAVAFASGANGTGCGVIDYNIQGDGSLLGRWGYWGKDEAGSENATRTGGTGLEGEYDATGKNPNGTNYKAKLTVEPAGNLYRFVWSNNTDGVGIRQGDNIAVGIGGTRCGFVSYEIKPDGLEGIWGGYGSDKTGTEKASKQ